MPNKIDESQVKFLINKANIELEAHNYKKSKKTCYQALKLDSENPVIYLILLLAQNKVTEIEDLKNCEINRQSESYKKLRRYAGKDLQEKLKKYLSDKEKYENIIVNDNKSPSLIKRFKTSIIEPVTKFLKSLVKKTNQKKQSNLNFLALLPNIIKDFYTDKRAEYDFSDFVDFQRYHNKIVRYNKSQKEDTDLLNQLPFNNETLWSASTYIYIITLSLQYYIMFGAHAFFFNDNDNNYIGFLCAIPIDLLLILIVKKNYLRILKLKEITNTSVLLNLLKSLFCFILSVVLLFTDYYLYFESFRCLFEKIYFKSLLFGIIGSLVVNYLYIQIYYYLRYFNVVRLHRKL